MMAIHSSTFAWEIPWTEEPDGLQSMGLQRVGYDWVTSLSLFTFMHWRRKWQPTPVFLPGESQGQRSLSGLPSMGSHRVVDGWGDLAAAAAPSSNPAIAGWVLLMMPHLWPFFHEYPILLSLSVTTAGKGSSFLKTHVFRFNPSG